MSRQEDYANAQKEYDKLPYSSKLKIQAALTISKKFEEGTATESEYDAVVGQLTRDERWIYVMLSD